ncbi:MAG: hypothetical protein RL434_2058 [Pseudomonadota bacterium]
MGTDNLRVAGRYGLPCVETGGASRDRTDDLLHAMQALSQLSYSPSFQVALSAWLACKKRGAKLREAPGSVKLEPTVSARFWPPVCGASAERRFQSRERAFPAQKL